MSSRQPSAVVEDVLAEAGFADDGALVSALEGIRALRPAAAPAPNGELAALLADASTLVPAIPHDRPAGVVQPLHPRSPKRHRGAMISVMVAAGMGLGATGVAALAGDPFGWISPDPPAAAVAEPRAASAPADLTPSPAIEALRAEPVAAAAETAAPEPAVAAAPDRPVRGTHPPKPASVKGDGQQGALGSAAAAGRELAKDIAAGPLAAAEHAVSDAVEGAVSGTVAATDDAVGAGLEASVPRLAASAGVEAGATDDGGGSEGISASGEIVIEPDAALEPTTEAVEDSVSALRELARVSRGEASGEQAEATG